MILWIRTYIHTYMHAYYEARLVTNTLCFVGLTTDKYVVLNSSVDLLPLKISFEPMELQV